MQLIERNRRTALLLQEFQRKFGNYSMPEAKRQFWATSLIALQPIPDQPHDTQIPTGGVVITKRARQMQIYGRVSEIIREQWGTRIRVALNSAVSPKLLKAAFAKIGRVQLRQMQNAALRAAGFVLEPEISATGEIDLCAVITDETAARKVASRTYTGAIICLDGDEITDISLVDSPMAFLEKRSTCKLYSKGEDVKPWKRVKRAMAAAGVTPPAMLAAIDRTVRKAALPPSATAVLAEQDRVTLLAQTNTDGLVVKALQERATAAYGLELVKAARSHPLDMVGFLRHGRP